MDATPHEIYPEGQPQRPHALIVLWSLALALLAGYFAVAFFG